VVRASFTGSLIAIALVSSAVSAEPREEGRLASARGDLKSAIDLFQRADAASSSPDPELHYLLGEALWAQGRAREARAVHQRARAELTGRSLDRMGQLWLARVEGRLGNIAAGDAIYATLLAANPADAEAALAQAEIHATIRDWARAEQLIRSFLATTPDHPRAQEMLAWFEEAQGDLGGALASYRRASEIGTAATSVTKALDRLDRLRAPELAARMTASSDPGASSLGVVTGAAVPFGTAHHVAIATWHEVARHGDRRAYAGELSAALVLQARDSRAIAGAKLGLFDGGVHPAAFGSATTTILGGHLQLAIDGELNSVWHETPLAVLEGGRVDGVTAHAYGIFAHNRIVTDTGVQVRRLALEETMVGSATAEQLLAWAGLDVALWTNFESHASGESLDDDLLRPAYLADSIVLSYRHYEMRGDANPMFASRIGLADRASIDEVSAVARKAFGAGRFAVDAHAGGGRDWARKLYLTRAGGALWFAASSRSRLTLSFDIAKESTGAFTGERRSGWMAYHVDL
jgi:tetratricopeptide (TPR) repeat protein